MNNTNRKVMRGEIYYVKNFPTVGHEQRSGRPAVIVSNNENNIHSGTYEICFMTLQDKPKLPTHVFIDRGPCINSTILCEQITTISEEKLGDFMCRIPEHLEEKLDEALAVSLALTTPRAKNAICESSNEETNRMVNALRGDVQFVQNELALAKDANSVLKKNLVEAKTKAEMYERMYNDLLDRLIKRG